MVIQADFCGNANLEFYREIERKVSSIDIGLLVLNAGIATKEKDTLG